MKPAVILADGDEGCPSRMCFEPKGYFHWHDSRYERRAAGPIWAAGADSQSRFVDAPHQIPGNTSRKGAANELRRASVDDCAAGDVRRQAIKAL
jgi:hypothetical protein